MKNNIQTFLFIAGGVIISFLLLVIVTTKVSSPQPATLQSLQPQTVPIAPDSQTKKQIDKKIDTSVTNDIGNNHGLICEDESKAFFEVKNLDDNPAYQSHYNTAEQKCLILITDGTSLSDFNAVLWDAYNGTKIAQFVTASGAFEGWCLINGTYGCTINQFRSFVQGEMSQ